MDWRTFQQLTAQLFRQLGCDAETDHPVAGVRASHNIDVWVTFKAHGFPVSWAVECKLWKERVKKTHVLTLRSIIEDVGADKGIVVSESGFQKGAVAATRKTNIALVSPDDLRRYLDEHLAGIEQRERSRGRAVAEAPSQALRAQLSALPQDAPASAYRVLLLHSHDQGVQTAAIKRLVQLRNQEAVILLAQRLLDPWGMSAIRRTQEALGQLHALGGLLTLSSFLLSDARFYYEKIEVIAKEARRQGDDETAMVTTGILETRVRSGIHFSHHLAGRLAHDIEQLRSLRNRDIALGVELSCFFCSPVWASVVTISRNLEVALAHADERLPGLINVLQGLDLAAAT